MRALQLSPSGASWAVSWGQLDALVLPEVVAVPEVAVPEVAVASWVVMCLLGPSEASWGYQVVASLSAAATEAAAATPWGGPVTTAAVEPAAWGRPSLLGGVAGGFISVL